MRSGVRCPVRCPWLPLRHPCMAADVLLWCVVCLVNMAQTSRKQRLGAFPNTKPRLSERVGWLTWTPSKLGMPHRSKLHCRQR